VDGVRKEIAIQSNKYYVAGIGDDAEKMFDQLFLALQLVLLLLAGAGMQGFTEQQRANMHNRTNRIITDIFPEIINDRCGLPQGSGFSVEIANLYAMFLLLWWKAWTQFITLELLPHLNLQDMGFPCWQEV